MSTPKDLKGIYTDELKDLWSANDQMKRVLKKITSKAADAALKEMLTNSQAGIEKHTDVLKELIAGQGEKVSKEHCKGMEGLVTEATKHVLEEGPKKGPLLDVVIIAQYQRMTHYGIAGFGTAAAYAKALGRKNDNNALRDATKEIYGGDEYMTKLAETSVNIEAKAAASLNRPSHQRHLLCSRDWPGPPGASHASKRTVRFANGAVATVLGAWKPWNKIR